MVLDEINVEGKRGQTADGPVPGYVATRSKTGSKTDTPLIETPQSISVIGRHELVDRGVMTLQEALAYTPGVATFASGRSLVLDEFLIRGFDTSAGDLGQLRDGLKLQANVYDGAQEPYGLERVEILKGPASILYGQLGPGGIVNSISKRPTFTQQGEINITGGSFENRQISADVSGPIGKSGEFAYRITGLYRDSNTWMNFIPNDRTYIAPALTWKPNSRTSLTLLGYFQNIGTRFKAPMNADGTVFPVAGVGRIPSAFFIGEPSFDKYKIDSGAAGYLLDHEFNNNVKLTSKARYYAAKADWDYLTYRGLDTTNLSDPRIVRGVSSRLEHSYSVTADNNIQAKFATGPITHTSIAGVDYAGTTYDTHRLRSGSGGSIDLYDPIYGASLPVVDNVDTGFNRRVDQVGVYFQDQAKILEKLVLLAGGRQDWAQTKTFSYSVDQFLPKQDDVAFTKRFGAVFLAPYGFAPYASYSESFSPVIAALVNAQEAKPTKGSQYEGGMRWQSPDEKTLVTASVYTIDQRNVVTYTSNGDFRQSGLVRSRGAELEAKSYIGPLGLTASYAYTDARTLQDEFKSLIGQQVAAVPLHQASVWATYDMTGLGLRGLTLGGGVRYFGRTNIPPDEYLGLPAGGNKVPGYIWVDGLARLNMGEISPSLRGFTGQLNVINLFNKVTYSCVAGFAACNFGQPRTVLATLTYRW